MMDEQGGKLSPEQRQEWWQEAGRWQTGAVGAGRLQATFDALPDAPFTRAVFELAGGKRGLLVNSANLCKARPRAAVRMLGQHNRGVLRQVGLGVGRGRG